MLRILFVFGLLIFGMGNSFSQNAFPVFDNSGLVSNNVDVKLLNKPYTILVYGSIGCGYSAYLIQHLHLLDTCKSKADIVLLMPQPKDTILKYMDTIINRYPTFSNAVINYKLSKHSDRYPQLLVFKNGIQQAHFLGLKKGMLGKVEELVLTGEQ
jgi:hypothetical protein